MCWEAEIVLNHLLIEDIETKGADVLRWMACANAILHTSMIWYNSCHLEPRVMYRLLCKTTVIMKHETIHRNFKGVHLGFSAQRLSTKGSEQWWNNGSFLMYTYQMLHVYEDWNYLYTNTCTMSLSINEQQLFIVICYYVNLSKRRKSRWRTPPTCWTLIVSQRLIHFMVICWCISEPISSLESPAGLIWLCQ